MRIFAQHTIKTAAAGWRENFTPVMFAYGCDLIGIQNSALKKIQAPKKFDPVQGKKPLRQVCEREIKSPKAALVRNVMDGQHSFKWKLLRMHKYRHQRCGPVVYMQDLQLGRQPT